MVSLGGGELRGLFRVLRGGKSRVWKERNFSYKYREVGSDFKWGG